MSIAAGTQRAGRPARPGSTRPGRLGGAISAIGRLGGRGRGRGMKRRHRRGITGTELRGFRKIIRLLTSVGMRPKGHHKRIGK